MHWCETQHIPQTSVPVFVSGFCNTALVLEINGTFNFE